MNLIQAAAVRRQHRPTLHGTCSYGCGDFPCDTRLAVEAPIQAQRDAVWAAALPRPNRHRGRGSRRRVVALALAAIYTGAGTILAAYVGPVLAVQLALLGVAALAALAVLFVYTGRS